MMLRGNRRRVLVHRDVVDIRVCREQASGMGVLASRQLWEGWSGRQAVL